MKTITNNTRKNKTARITSFLFLFIGIWIFNFNVSAAETDRNTNSNSMSDYSSAEITSVRQCHNVREGGQLGMVILVSFDIDNARGASGQIAAWFYDDYGNKLIDFNDNFSSTDGQVCTYTTFYPKYTNTVFSEVRLFIPYSELHVRSGYVPLNFKVGIFNGYTLLDESSYCSFNTY